MSITTCQKVTLISCSVLCVSLFLPRMLLPRAKEVVVQPEVGPGFYPPMMHRLPLSQDSDQWGIDPLHSMTHNAETVVKVKGTSKKYNLMAQVIPIYGFGILLYIIYIIYKLTCKEKSTKSGNFTTTYNAPVEKTVLNEYELARLHQRLLQTEQMMEMIVSGKSRHTGSSRSRRSQSGKSKREEKLLRHLRQITDLMQEGRLEGTSPEMEAEEVPYCADWDGYPEETYPVFDESCNRRRYKPVTLTEITIQPTAEALAERMEQEEEEVGPRKLEVVHEEDEEEDAEEDDDHEEQEEEQEVEEETDTGMEQKEDGAEEEEEDEEDDEEEDYEEEVDDKKWLLSPPSPMLASENKKEYLGLEVATELRSHSPCKKITFSEHQDVYRYPRQDTYEEDQKQEEEDEEEEEEEEDSETEEELAEMQEVQEVDEVDPVMEAESLLFSCEVGTSPEKEAEEETEDSLMESEEGPVHMTLSKQVTVSGLRMRNKRDT